MKRILLGLLLSTLLGAQVGPLPGSGPFMPMEPTASGCGAPVVTNIGTNSNTSGTTLTLTGLTVPASSLIVVVVVETSATIGTLSDGVNTYTLGRSQSFSSGSSIVGIFYAPNAALSGGTITYTKVGSGNTAAISALRASNILTASPLDTAVTVSTSGSTTTSTLTSGTPAQSGELFIAGFGYISVPPTFTEDTGHGWAAPPNQLLAVDGTTLIAGGSQVNAGTSTKIFAPTLTGASVTVWGSIILGFKHC